MENIILEALLEVTGKDFGGNLEAALEAYSPRELLDIWLRYEGICGYTDRILNALHALDALKAGIYRDIEHPGL